MRQILLNLVRTPAERRDHKLVDELIATTTKHWRIMNGRLEGRHYMMGPRFTMVDIVFASHVYRWFAYPIARPELLHLEAWYKRLCERKHYNPHFTAGDAVSGLRAPAGS